MTVEVARRAESRRAAAGAARHRALLVIGESDAAAARAAAVAACGGDVVWLAPPGTVNADVRFLTGRSSRVVLGTEIDTLVVDLWATCDPDAIGATVGAVRAGGLVVVLVPPAGAPDPSAEALVVTPFVEADVGHRFVDRVRRTLRFRREGGTWWSELTTGSDPGAAGGVPRTADQGAAVDALVALGSSADPPPVVLTSDRGRGKSSALGIAAARLLAAAAVSDITVTAPASAGVVPVFDRARELLGPDHPGLRFRPPRDVLATPVPFLLVDEAAAFPVPVLERLLATHPRIAFATTVHGYEGTGRGFAVRFRKVLDARAPGWSEVHLREPIRWAEGDPVEAWATDALLLSADAAPTEAFAAAPAPPADPAAAAFAYVRLDRDALAADERRLSELFGLLVLAHYRTSPADLRRLLDAPNLTTHALLHDGRVAAAAVVAAEGGLTEDQAEAILVGRHRPRGHMLPEVLATHLGWRAGAMLPSARVVRIAVHPALQGRGLGTRLLDHLAAAARADGASLLGAGFGATADLIRFWRRAGLHPVRLGVRRGAASGVYSAIVLRSLHPDADAPVAALHARFDHRLPHQLSDPHRDLDRPLARELSRGPGASAALPDAPIPGLDVPPPSDLDLTPADLVDLLAIAFGPRIYDAAVAPCWKLVMRALSDPRYRSAVEPGTRDLLLAKAIDKRGWHDLTDAFGFPDLHATMRAFRDALAPLVMELGRDAAEHARARFNSPRRLLGPPDPAVRTAALRRLGFAVATDEISDRRAARMRRVLERKQLDLQLVLDNLWDPHNAAAVLRSADAFGVGAVDLVYTHERFPRISDLAAGYTKRWSLMNRHTSIEDCYASLRARGLRIVATGPARGAVSYLEVDWTQPTALVIGHERDGCSEYALDQADQTVVIPMRGFAQSLNVSVATAVLLAEIARQRAAAGALPEDAWTPWHEQTLQQWRRRDEEGVAWQPIWPPDVRSPEGDD